MNVTYVRNYVERPIVFTDFENEMWSIIILCTLILTRGIVSTVYKWFHDGDTHHHVHYSNEYSTADLQFSTKSDNANDRGLFLAGCSGSRERPAVAMGSDIVISEFDAYEGLRAPPNTPKKKPREPSRDELV